MSKPPFEHANLATSTGDDRAAVRENRRALCRLLGVVPSRVNMMRQVHGAHVRRVDGPLRPGRFCGGLDGWPVADGMVTDRPGVPLVVLAADCVPVLLWRMTGSAVGVAHAGWKGLMAGAVAAVRTALPGSGPIGAAIGPCIDQYNYEVDQGLAERFTARFGDRAVDGRLVNLRLCARIALEGCGVSADRIQDVARSTAEDDFFSHRKEGPRTGRQAGVVWIG
jgi:YfiH family protein